jgi:hypothetical protein
MILLLRRNTTLLHFLQRLLGWLREDKTIHDIVKGLPQLLGLLGLLRLLELLELLRLLRLLLLLLLLLQLLRLLRLLRLLLLLLLRLLRLLWLLRLLRLRRMSLRLQLDALCLPLWLARSGLLPHFCLLACKW